MKKTAVIVLLVMTVSFALFAPTNGARAQGETSYVVDTTIPVEAEIRSAVDAWLAVSAPIPLPYWAITYVEQNGFDTFVSLVALDLALPSDPWRMTEGNTVVWMGSVIVHEDDTIEMFSENPQANVMKFPAMPKLGPGGGANVRFPWQSGGTMMYGPRGIHAAGGGGSYATGFSAVDFVGGDDMGSGVASPSVYAVDTGTVDYVCADDTTTLVRTANTGTDSYYIYAHLLDNANLVMDHAFTQGSLIGSVKYGTFDDNCGYADQTARHYHLHFGFEPANGSFRMEGCILSMSTKKWTCGTETISTGQFLKGGGGISGVGDDGGNSIPQPSFFDYVLTGVVTLWDRAIVQNLPSHSAIQYTYVIYSTAKLVLRMAYVLVYSNVNLFYLMTVVLIGFAVKLLFGLAEFIVFLFKAWKSLVPILGA